MKFATISLFLIILLLFSVIYAGDDPRVRVEEQWAVGMVARMASIPFATNEAKTVSTLVPLIFYEGERWYMNGIEGGYRFYSTGDWDFSAMGRLRFFDIPQQYQNLVQGDNVDWGFQAKYQPFAMTYLDIEGLSDYEGNISSNVRAGLDIYTGGFNIRPFAEAKIKGRKFNSYYFGLDSVNINGGVDLSVGFVVDYHLLSNFYLYGAGKLTLLDRQVRNSALVSADMHGQVFFGIGLSNDRSKPRKEKLSSKAYFRLSLGFATPSDLSNIIKFNATRDTADNHMTSIFYGHPLADELFGLPLDIYITSGLVWHWESEVQPNSQELVLGVKLYYTIKWPIRWKFGAAEGLSWANKIPFVEASEMERKGYRPSNLLNYLDFTLDFNLGDVFGGQVLEELWLGYGIHHRSAIFEKAQQFGRIRGGSNFQTFYLQYHF